MKLTRDQGRGAVAGVVAAGAGLAVSELLSGFAHLRVSPVEAVAESIIRLTPGSVIEFVISHLGHDDKPLVIALDARSGSRSSAPSPASSRCGPSWPPRRSSR